MSIKANTLKRYFMTSALNEDANKNIASFSNDSIFTTNATFSSEIKSNLTKDIDSIILAKAPGSSSLTMYHIITNLVGTRSKLDNKFVGLLGFGPESTAVIFNKDSITTPVQ